MEPLSAQSSINVLVDIIILKFFARNIIFGFSFEQTLNENMCSI